MPVKYAHITWTDSPEAVANQLEKWAEYLLKDAEKLKSNLKQDLYSKPANDQMQIQYENPEGWKDKSRILIDIVDDLEKLQKLREKIHVVELKTKAEKWEEWAVTQRPLYTKEAIQKLPDDIIYLISTYLEDELTLTEDVGGRVEGLYPFRSTWWKGDVQVMFVNEVERCLNIWSIDALKMFWVKNVLPKMTFVHVYDLQYHFQTSGQWDNEETNGWYRAYLVRAIMKWNKAKLIENFTKLFSVSADTNCSFKFQMEVEKQVSGIYGIDFTDGNKTYNQKFFVSLNNYKDNIICNKDMYHILKSVKWIDRRRNIEIKKYKNKDMKNVDTFYPINPNLFLDPNGGYLDNWEWDKLHNEYIERNPNHFREAHYRPSMLHLDKVVPRLTPQ
jgi:hypothetical protein